VVAPCDDDDDDEEEEEEEEERKGTPSMKRVIISNALSG